MNKAITKYEIDRKGNCWNWTGEITEKGYGRININGRRISAHRYFYNLFVGEIPEELEVDHLCRNKKCVNPQHLEAVTHSENIRRAWAERIKNTPNCKKGHPYFGNNLYIASNKKNGKKWRVCKKCRALCMRKLRNKN